ASERRRALSFVAEVSRVIWGGKVVGWHEGSHLAEAAARAGLDLDELDAAIAADPGRHDAVIAENQRALEAAGHWGVPTMVFAGELSSGQDRMDPLVWRLRQHGLRPVGSRAGRMRAAAAATRPVGGRGVERIAPAAVKEKAHRSTHRTSVPTL